MSFYIHFQNYILYFTIIFRICFFPKFESDNFWNFDESDIVAKGKCLSTGANDKRDILHVTTTFFVSGHRRKISNPSSSSVNNFSVIDSVLDVKLAHCFEKEGIVRKSSLLLQDVMTMREKIYRNAMDNYVLKVCRRAASLRHCRASPRNEGRFNKISFLFGTMHNEWFIDALRSFQVRNILHK